MGLYWDYVGIILGLYWSYIGVILGLYWDYIGVILGLYWGYIRVILGGYSRVLGDIGIQWKRKWKLLLRVSNLGYRA